MPYRRMRRRSRGKRYQSSVMHLPSSMANNPMASESVVMFAAVASNYATTGTSLTSDTFENADRSQLVPIGADIPSIVYNIAIRNATATAVLEFAFFKIERAHEVPQTNDVLLPSNATINSLGLQAAFRQYQPGRLLKYMKIAVAAEQPRAFSTKINYAKFKMVKMRTGDYYGVIIFNRGSMAMTIDIEARYNAKV